MTLLESVARLALTLALVIWLPGWMASRRPLWPVRLLQPAALGLTLHFVLLVAIVTFTTGLESMAWAVVSATALASASLLLLRLRARRRLVPDRAARLPAPLTALVAVAVGLAAALRWFHNYHFDDTQHLLYLTEIERQGLLFPREFMLHVPWASLPDHALVVSRYPFWAAAHAVFARVSGVPMADSYYIIGLAALAFTLALLARLLHELLDSRLAAAAALSGLLAGGHVLGDDVLNFGGYPFQTGELFVFVAAVALGAFVRFRDRGCLLYVAMGVLTAPLLHTNNAVGAALVLLAGACAAAVLRSRALVAATLVPASLVLLVSGIALLSGGFMQLERISSLPGQSIAGTRQSTIPLFPDNPAARGGAVPPGTRLPKAEAPPRFVGRLADYTVIHHSGWYLGIPPSLDVSWEEIEDATGMPGVLRGRTQAELEQAVATVLRDVDEIDRLAIDVRGNVMGRGALFLERAAPVELLPVAIVVLGHFWLVRWPRRRRWFGAVALAAAAAVTTVAWGTALARQAASVALKPGYWHMRSGLMEAADLVRGLRVLTDPVTHVYGTAAGWQLEDPPPVTLEEQFALLLLFHPDVDADAVAHLWPAGERRLVVNEAVLGPAAARRFDASRTFERLRHTGNALPGQLTFAQEMAVLVARMYSLDYALGSRELADQARILWRMLFRRPLYVFSVSPGRQIHAARTVPPVSLLLARDRSDVTETTERRAFLNAAILRASLPAGCFKGARFRLEPTASFTSPVLIHVLPTGAAASHWIDAVTFRDRRDATVIVPFLEPVCGPGELTFFLHGNRWYDFRFEVEGPNWIRSASGQPDSEPTSGAGDAAGVR